jgi:hypothetical protein
MLAQNPDPVRILADLIAIDSVNPGLVAGAAGETGRTPAVANGTRWGLTPRAKMGGFPVPADRPGF